MLVFTVALALRAGLGIALGPSEPVLDDQREYLALRDVIRSTGDLRHPETGRPTALRDPGYPVFLALADAIGVRSTPAIYALQALLSSVTVALLFFVTHRALGARAGAASAALGLGYIVYASYSFYVYSETFATFLLVSLLWSSSVWIRRPTLPAQLMTGSVAAALLLTRFAMVGVVAGVLAALLAARRPVRQWGLIMIVPLAASLVWCARNAAVVGVFAPNSNGAWNFYLGHHPSTPLVHSYRAMYDEALGESLPKSPESARVRAARESALEHIRSHPGRAALRTVLRIPDALELDRQLIGVARRGQFPERSARSLWVIAGLAALASAPLLILGFASALGPTSHWLVRAGHWSLWGAVAIQALTIAHARFTVPAWVAIVPAAAAFVAGGAARSAPGRWRVVAAGVVLGGIWLRQLLLA
jgi:hypothetical protein